MASPRIEVRKRVIATSQRIGWWMVATRALMKQENLTAEEARHHRARACELRSREGGGDRGLIEQAFADHLRRDFHPDPNHNCELARSFLESVGPA